MFDFEKYLMSEEKKLKTKKKEDLMIIESVI
jgi:hypothetical protein